MGYYVNIEAGEWIVLETPEALAAIREMPKKYHAIMRGGSSSGERWFSWMNNADIENAESVESVFQALGFETRTVKDPAYGKAFEIGGYDNKTGQEDLFLAVMAPYTVIGSWLHWRGEDDTHWRYDIDHNHRMRVSDGEQQITFGAQRLYAYDHLALLPNDEWKRLAIDPADPAVEEKLALAESWNKQKEAEYAKLREEREAQKV